MPAHKQATMNGQPLPLDRSPRATGWVIATIVIGNSVLDVALMTQPSADALRWVVRSTHGLVRAPLIMCALEGAVLIAGMMIVTGKLRWADVGLDRRKLLPGIAFAVGVWAVVQVVTLAATAASGDGVAWHPQWTQRPLRAIGRIASDWLAVAVYEETVYRGFLLTQLRIHLNRLAGGHRWLTLGLAVVISQALFSLGHLPYLLHHGLGWEQIPADLVYLFAAGILFAVVYLATCNLFVGMAVHAMLNAPALIGMLPNRSR
ncbi:MAG: CPBP family intramembrane metalloprotease [Phycisphaerales bacterium]|nr:CPBP family intramembrane metalloprotease [Phycisphaerales bacterium]